jgi:hypothetical protein
VSPEALMAEREAALLAMEAPVFCEVVCPFLGEEVFCFMIYGIIGIKEYTRRALFRHRSSASPPHRRAAATAGGRHQLGS